MPPRVLVLRAPGSNCDAEAAFAFQRGGAVADIVHLNRWLESPRLSDGFQILCIPGGFSYGDDVAAGRIFANRLRYHLEDAIDEFRRQEKLILGICNGFQVLAKCGLLDNVDSVGAAATLTWNASGRFIDRWVKLRVMSDHACPFLTGIDELELPIAHAEGQFRLRDDATGDEYKSRGQLALRYDSTVEGGNPNGSECDVAGMCDRSGRVFGLMPHPERFIDPTQHPEWTREAWRGEGDGLRMFRNAVRYFA